MSENETAGNPKMESLKVDTPGDEVLVLDIDMVLGLSNKDEATAISILQNDSNFIEHDEKQPSTSTSGEDIELIMIGSNDTNGDNTRSNGNLFVSIIQIFGPKSDHMGTSNSRELVDEERNMFIHFMYSLFSNLFPEPTIDDGSNETSDFSSEELDLEVEDYSSDNRYISEYDNSSSDSYGDDYIIYLYDTSPFVSHEVEKTLEEEKNDDEKSIPLKKSDDTKSVPSNYNKAPTQVITETSIDGDILRTYDIKENEDSKMNPDYKDNEITSVFTKEKNNVDVILSKSSTKDTNNSVIDNEIMVIRKSNETTADKPDVEEQKNENDTKITLPKINEGNFEGLRSLYYNYKDFSIPNSFVCPNNGKELNLLIGIHSRVRDFERRVAIRQTWARAVKLLKGVQYAFIVGIGLAEDIDRKLKQESDFHRDIIQTDILDKKENSEANPVMFLKWVQNYCSKVKFIAKVEDNIFLNVPQLYEAVKDDEGDDHIMYGFLVEKKLPIRDPKNEIEFVPKNLYEPYVYPNYFKKEFYIIPGKFAGRLYKEAEQFPYFPMENILITGILAQKIGMRREDASVLFLDYSKQSGKDKIENCSSVSYCVIHPLEPEDMRDLWSVLKKNSFKCFNFFQSIKEAYEGEGLSPSVYNSYKILYPALVVDQPTPLY